jgi:hypothetical protein
MNAMIVAPRTAQGTGSNLWFWTAVSSRITKRVYNLGLDEFFEWFEQRPHRCFAV